MKGLLWSETEEGKVVWLHGVTVRWQTNTSLR